MMQIVVPALGESISEATITKWLKKAGDTVAADEPLVELETDKVTVEVLAPAAGMLMDILAVGGDTVKVGAVLGSLEEEETSSPPPVVEQTEEDAPFVSGDIPAGKPLQPSPVIAMPSARKMMQENAIDPASLTGSGKGGRITKEDVLKHLKALSVTPLSSETTEEIRPAEEGSVSEHGDTRTDTETFSEESPVPEASAWCDEAAADSDETAPVPEAPVSEAPPLETPIPEAMESTDTSIPESNETVAPAPETPLSDVSSADTSLSDDLPSDIPTVGVFALPDDEPMEEKVLSEAEAADVATLMDEISAVIQASSQTSPSIGTMASVENAANENVGDGLEEKTASSEDTTLPPASEDTAPDEDSAAVFSVMEQISGGSFPSDIAAHDFGIAADIQTSDSPAAAFAEGHEEESDTFVASSDTEEEEATPPLPDRIESIEDFMPLVEETIENVSSSVMDEPSFTIGSEMVETASAPKESGDATPDTSSVASSSLAETTTEGMPESALPSFPVEESISPVPPSPVANEKVAAAPVIAFMDSLREQRKERSETESLSETTTVGETPEDDKISPSSADASGQTTEDAPSSPDAEPSSFAREGKREERVRMTRLRKRIAERLKEAQNTAATLTTFNEVDMTGMNEMRARHKEAFEKKYGVKLGLMSFFVKAAVAALKEWPAVNAEIENDYIVYKNYYDIGVAVGTPNGLVVPVIREADRLSFADIENAIATYGNKAREGKLSIEDLIGGTFTISNGGIYGSLMSTPILNPPQSGILGMHKIQMRPVVMPDGSIQARPMMYLALSYDHRIIDGREAVSFLISVKNAVENPERLLLDL